MAILLLVTATDEHQSNIPTLAANYGPTSPGINFPRTYLIVIIGIGPFRGTGGDKNPLFSYVCRHNLDVRSTALEYFPIR